MLCLSSKTTQRLFFSLSRSLALRMCCRMVIFRRFSALYNTYKRGAIGAKPHANCVALNHSKDAFSSLWFYHFVRNAFLKSIIIYTDVYIRKLDAVEFRRARDWCHWYEWCVELFIYTLLHVYWLPCNNNQESLYVVLVVFLRVFFFAV